MDPLPIIWALVLLGAARSAIAAQNHGTRPGEGGQADEIGVGIGVLDIVGIDNRAQTFSVDLYLQVEWRDPRLAAMDNADSAYRTFATSDVWSPGLTVVNDRGLDPRLPDVVTVDRLGNVVLRQRYTGSLSVNLDLREFPFDAQRLPIQIVSYRYTPEELTFSAESLMVGRFDSLSSDGWTFRATEPETSIYRLSDDAPGRSMLTFTVLARRDAGYYVLTLALPMTLILFLAWVAHWVPPELIPARMGIASATVFSLIAFGVSFRLTLPQIAYLTVADRFVLYSTLLVFASLTVIVMSVTRVSSGRQDAAIRLTRLARIAFPILYIVILAMVAL